MRKVGDIDKITVPVHESNWLGWIFQTRQATFASLKSRENQETKGFICYSLIQVQAATCWYDMTNSSNTQPNK